LTKQSYLERAVISQKENGNKWYACQALRTLGRCHLVMHDETAALNKAASLSLAEAIGDRQALCESRCCLPSFTLTETYPTPAELHKVTEQSSDSPTDLNSLRGSKALRRSMSQGDPSAQHFGRSVPLYIGRILSRRASSYDSMLNPPSGPSNI